MKWFNTRRAASTVIFSIFVFLVSYLAAAPAPAAQEDDTDAQAGIGFLMGFPQGEFDDNVEENGYGIGGDFLYSPSFIPFGIGASFGYMRYGTQTRREPFSTTIPDVEVDVKTTNNIVLAHLLFRAQLKSGPIRPYVDGLLGFNYLFTETSIEDVDDRVEVASSDNLDDGVFSYGGGGGFTAKLYSGSTEDSQRFSLWLDCRVRYIVGGKAEYLKKGSIRTVGGKVAFDVIESKTDILTAQIGLTIEI